MKTLRLLSVFALTLFVGLSTVNCGGNETKEPTPTPADKSALITKIAEAKGIRDVSTQGTDPGQYPVTVMTSFNTAITTAETVKNNAFAIQTEVDAAVTALTTAIATFQAGVVPVPTVDKSALDAALTAAQGIYDSAVAGYLTGNYRQTDKTDFGAVLTAQLAVYNNASATQAEVDAAVTAVNTAKTTFQGKMLTKDYDQYLSLHLKMDGNTTDESYDQHTATLYKRSGSDIPQLTADRHGVANKAYAFNGNQIYVPNAATLVPSNISISVWIKPASITGEQAIISMNWWDGYMFKSGGTQMFFQSMNAGGAYVGTWTEIAIGTWYHVVMTRSDSEFNIYVNGMLDNTAPITPPAGMTLPTEQPLVIGAMSHESDEYPFNGAIDEVRVYSKALTASEVTAIYNAEKP